MRVDRTTLKLLMERADITERQGQVLTQARLEALELPKDLWDIRVTYKVACAWKAFASHNSAEYKWNFDCTTVIVSGENTNTMRCVVRNRDRTGKVEAKNVNSALDLLVKIPTLGSASGELGRLVSIVAIPELGADDYFKATVAGFTISTNGADRDGYIYFCHSKCGCAKLWQDIFMTFIIPTIASAAEYYQHKYDDGYPMEPLVHSDGEMAILKEAFNSEVMSMFLANRINYLKGGPSHTSKTQDLDCGSLFSSLKAGIKSIAKQNTNVKKATLRKNIEAAISQFQNKYNIELGLQKEKIIYSHEVIVYAAQKHWNPHKMRESSVVVGLHREGQSKSEETIDFDRIMTRTLNTEVTSEELAHMKEKSSEVAMKFKTDGKYKHISYHYS